MSGRMSLLLSRWAPGLVPGGLYALAAALLFGASTPFAKLLLIGTSPWLLAGILYLGAGLGLLAFRWLTQRVDRGREASLSAHDAPWLGGAIVLGGIVGPVLLMYGLAFTPASTASLLLTLEAVFTALVAWCVFREHFHWRIGIGMIAITTGAAGLVWPEAIDGEGMLGPLLIIGACFAWALDNNLTRNVSLKDPLQIAMLKGLVAGAVNVAIAMALGSTLPSSGHAVLAGLVGLIGYGMSLALFVLALRHIGTARSSAYFATAPFVGAIISIFVFGEPPTIQLVLAAGLMGLGVWLHLMEDHRHEHTHEPLMHTHRHRHDAHHRHAHSPEDPPGEPHSHAHAHSGMTHRHPHYPDIHHRHSH